MELTRRRMLLGLSASGAAAVGAGVLLTREGPPPPSRGAGQWTSFGSVALTGWSRRSLAAPTEHEAGHVHGAAPGAASVEPPDEPPDDAAAALVPSAVHGAWTDAVGVDLRVHNGTQGPIELSPGQFRVRVDGGDMTVSLYRTDRTAAPVEAGASADLHIDYLVPPAGSGLTLEFTDALSARTHHLGRLGDGGAS
jgi:hypothetical protein